jgi:hypothetical protein
MVNHPSFEPEALNIRWKKKSTIKAIWFKILLENVITTKKSSQRGLDGRLQDYK